MGHVADGYNKYNMDAETARQATKGVTGFPR